MQGQCLRHWLCCCCVDPSAKEDTEDDGLDEVYCQNKEWLALALQCVYLIFLCLAIPYVFVWSEHKDDPQWLPVRVFLPVTGVCSVIMFALYFKFKLVQPIIYSLVTYATVSPYVSWVCQQQYMATPANYWMWLTVATLVALLLTSPRLASWLLVLQIITTPVGGLVDLLIGVRPLLHPFLLRLLYQSLPNCTIYLLMLFFSRLLAYSRRQAMLKHELNQSILCNILPAPIAVKLMDGLAESAKIHIAQDFPMATVCFCDIVGFTSLCLTTSPNSLVDTLNSIFTYFDRLCLLHGVEKIKTIGDAYMFAGFPAPGELPTSSALAVMRVAIRMLQHMSDFHIAGHRLQIRIGAHSGPVVAGVIGCTKFCYDIWGPTVNMASRLESSGIPSEIQVSEATKELVSHVFPCNCRGPVQLKGAGEHVTYLVDMSSVPHSEEGPEVLDGLGLSDMALLVQEINRRQTRYIFASSAVSPLPISPRESLRQTPKSKPITQSFTAITGSCMPEAGETKHMEHQCEEVVVQNDNPHPCKRSSRIRMLSQAITEEEENTNGSPLAEVDLTEMPSCVSMKSMLSTQPSMLQRPVEKSEQPNLNDLLNLSWLPEVVVATKQEVVVATKQEVAVATKQEELIRDAESFRSLKSVFIPMLATLGGLPELPSQIPTEAPAAAPNTASQTDEPEPEGGDSPNTSPKLVAASAPRPTGQFHNGVLPMESDIITGLRRHGSVVCRRMEDLSPTWGVPDQDLLRNCSSTPALIEPLTRHLLQSPPRCGAHSPKRVTIAVSAYQSPFRREMRGSCTNVSPTISPTRGTRRSTVPLSPEHPHPLASQTTELHPDLTCSKPPSPVAKALPPNPLIPKPPDDIPRGHNPRHPHVTTDSQENEREEWHERFIPPFMRKTNRIYESPAHPRVSPSPLLRQLESSAQDFRAKVVIGNPPSINSQGT